MNIISKKWLFFLISGIVIVPGIVSLVFWGLRPAIDFTGGTLIELAVSGQVSSPKADRPLDEVVHQDELKKIITDQNIEVGSVQATAEKSLLFRTKPMDTEQHKRILEEVKKKYPDVAEIRYENVGPSIGKETTKNASLAVIVASLAIILYIAWAFRKIPQPYSSWSFGICAVAALLHDVLLVIGLFSLFGHFLHVEVDSLFITALMTIMGFSVHDTIVVFDRIRENLRRMSGDSFAVVVNESIVQTLVRSVSTSLTVIFTLTALLLFGGESIRWFVVALLIGIISGTYSSIFNAAPLLVVWEEWKQRRKKV